MYLIPGVLGFFACCLFDINKIKWQSKKLNLLFVLGVIMILFSTVCCVLQSDLAALAWPWSFRQILCLICLILSCIALVYTLFFALPFADTYVESDTLPLVDQGVYGLCRHPGFWMLACVYLFLWLFFDSQPVLFGFVLYTICNFIYVYVQDRYIFPLYIGGYDEYKRSVPFLIPNRDSIRKAFRQ